MSETEIDSAGSDLTVARAHTLCGLTPVEIHDRFWASRGVAVVRRGIDDKLDAAAELFLLTDPRSLVLFRLRDLLDVLSWLSPSLLMIRLRDEGQSTYREVVVVDPRDYLLEFNRVYEGLDSRLARVALTASRDVARMWQAARSREGGWRQFREKLPRDAIQGRRISGRVFDANRPEQLMAHLECLMEAWAQPNSTLTRLRRGPSSSWVDLDGAVERGATLLGRVWVGAGRRIEAGAFVAGPAVLWDAPGHVPQRDAVPWGRLEPGAIRRPPSEPRSPDRLARASKRVFDICFALVAILLTAPLYPFIALAIWLEDGFPIFFGHRRETLGGREFSCLKFRSMRRDAESVRVALQDQNVSDGPQFFVERDPRATRVGRVLRATQLDELPQFWNVLVGDMSVVGPRPSPRHENQYCPPWREARLSIRPGVTGLWQVERTRAQGLDFQEWIRLDLEYVERMNWRLDLWIILKTCGVVIRRAIVR